MPCPTLVALRKIVEELRHGVDAGHQEMIPRARTGDVEQVALGVIYLLQIRIVSNGLDTLLQGNNFVMP
jgi:hypothetical protein